MCAENLCSSVNSVCSLWFHPIFSNKFPLLLKAIGYKKITIDFKYIKMLNNLFMMESQAVKCENNNIEHPSYVST